VWLTPHAAVAREGHLAIDAWDQLDETSHETCCFYFSADGEEINALARSPEHLLEICDVVLRLLAASVVHSVRFTDSTLGSFMNAPTLAHLMEQCQSLKCLRLEQIEMDEDHFRVLGAYWGAGLEIVLISCKIMSAGASALVEVLERNQGPTRLDFCDIDNFVVANGLRGNSPLKSFRPRLSGIHDDGNREVLAIAATLKENKSIVELNLWHDFRMSDETWDAVCDSLKTHPTLEVLDLRSMYASGASHTLSPAKLKSRIQALWDMMKTNVSIHTIHLRDHYRQYELFRGTIIPYLVTNRLRPRLLAIQRTRPILYRAKVLRRALL
jgi:hypothetical protein